MLIDLSVAINNDTPVYPGDPVVQIKPAGILSKDGFNDHLLSIGTHVGTHIDAPMHMFDGGKTLDQYPLEHFMGRGRYIRIENGQFSIDAVKNADIQEGDVVIFHTGFGDDYDNPDRYFKQYPAIPADIAQYLVEKEIKMVGTDTCSPDYPDFPIHKIFLAGDVLILENLTNIEEVAGKEFKIMAFPLKLEIDASPVRVVAEVV